VAVERVVGVLTMAAALDDEEVVGVLTHPASV